MIVFRRILAALTFFLSAAMLLASLVGGVGVWIKKGPATAKANQVFGHIEAALEVAAENVGQVKSTLNRAAERLNDAREQQRKLAQEPSNSALRRTLVRMVQRGIGPDLDNAHEKLRTIAQATVVVNNVLDDLGNFPFLSMAGLDLDRLTEMNDQIAVAGPAAWELSRLRGDREPDSDAEAQESRIERSLRSINGLLAEFEPQLTDVRRRTEQLKSNTLPWITPAAILISGVCFW